MGITHYSLLITHLSMPFYWAHTLDSQEYKFFYLQTPDNIFRIDLEQLIPFIDIF